MDFYMLQQPWALTYRKSYYLSTMAVKYILLEINTKPGVFQTLIICAAGPELHTISGYTLFNSIVTAHRFP